MQKNPRIWWLCGWFPANSSPLAGNFIWRHAQAVWRNFRSTELILFHFPTYFWGQLPPKPVGDEWGEWVIDTRYSLNYGYRWQEKRSTVEETKAHEVNSGQLKWVDSNEVNSSNAMLLYFRPVVQFRSKYLLSINFFYYTFIVIYRLMRMNALLGKPKVVHLHVADKIGMPFWITQKLIWAKVSAYYTEHWAIFGTPVQDRYEKRNAVFRFYYKKVWANIDVAASISVFTHQWMQRTFHEAKQMIFLPNVVNTEQFKYNSDSFSSSKDFLHVSNFEKRKRVLEIIAAFQYWKEYLVSENTEKVKLRLVGADKDLLERQLAALVDQGFLINGKWQKIDLHDVNLVWMGKLSSEIVAQQMQQSKALILFSTAENAPCVISEALCSGLPVISNKLAAIPEMIIDGENGLLIDDSIEDLVTAIHGIMRKDDYDRKHISIAAKKNYYSENVVTELIQSYKEVIDGGKS